MERADLRDLYAFVAVAQARSFTKAAARLGVSQSALSHTIRHLEERHQVKLLTRTTRSVSPTAAGKTFLNALTPIFSQLNDAFDDLHHASNTLTGTVRITSGKLVAHMLLWPCIEKLSQRYPNLVFEIDASHRLHNIVTEGFDAGIRLGEQIEQDMIAVRISPPKRMAVVGSPDYFAQHAPPLTPHDLTDHACINLRLPTKGGLYLWEFERDGRPLNVRVNGPLIFNDTDLTIEAALKGFGLTCVLDDAVQDHLQKGRLIRVLEDWCPPFPGYYLYYPSRRHVPPGLAVLIEALRNHQ